MVAFLSNSDGSSYQALVMASGTVKIWSNSARNNEPVGGCCTYVHE